MMNEQERDELGNVVFKLTPEDRERIRRSQYTYIFRYYDEKKEHHFPHWGLFSSAEAGIAEARKDPEFMEVELYAMPDTPPYSFFIRHHNGQLGLLVHFFKEVFEERAFLEGYMPDHKYSRVILPKKRYEEIINVINDNGLLPIRDLIFEIIAIAQNKYVGEMVFWDSPERQKIINGAPEAARQAIKLLEKLDDGPFLRGEAAAKVPPELKGIRFIFSDETVKIDHPWMAKQVLQDFKRALEEMPYRDWRKELERWPDRFEELIRKGQFKYMLTWSLYNLLIQTKLMNVTQVEPFPNAVMLCIVRILEFCLIPVGKEGELESLKIKHVRNWLTRKELEPVPTEVEVKPNMERLQKYFEKEFIEMPKDIKGLEGFRVAVYLAKRFDIEPFVADLTQIAQALIDVRWLMDHQILGEGRPLETVFDEFDAWSKLLNGVKGEKKIVNLKYKLEGDDKEYELTSVLPLHQVGEALKEYMETHRADIEVEPVPTKIIRTEEDVVRVERAEHFHEPANRFMVRFVTAFYDYLLAEVPHDDHGFRPSDKFYSIIASMLIGARYFTALPGNENGVIPQVMAWHELELTERAKNTQRPDNQKEQNN
jgi:hypothetical protein